MKLVRGETETGEIVWAQPETESGIWRRVEDALDPARRRATEEVRLRQVLAPVESPRLLICLGLNYGEHAEALGVARPAYPVVVPKSITAIQHPGAPIYLPAGLPVEKVDYEAELVVVLGREARSVRAEEALDYVLGYTCGNDVSARDWQFEKGGGQWSRGKSFDTFAPLGPCLITGDDLGDPGRLEIRSWVNGELRQESSTARMVFSVGEIVAFLSASSTLPPGTVIMTGTPAGVGMKQVPPTWLQPGDEVRVEIERIGTLINRVEAEPA